MTAYSPIFRVAEMVPADPALKNAWGAIQTASVPLYEQGATGVVSVAIGGLTSYSLTTANNAADQARYAWQNYTGALGGDCTVTIPNVQRFGRASNSTSGGHNIILSSGAGTKATLPADQVLFRYYCDGAGNVVLVGEGSGGSVVQGNQSVTGTVTASALSSSTITQAGVAVPQIRTGVATTDGAGSATISFTTITGSGSVGIVATQLSGGSAIMSCDSRTFSSAVIFSRNSDGSPRAGVGFSWIAFGV